MSSVAFVIGLQAQVPASKNHSRSWQADPTLIWYLPASPSTKIYRKSPASRQPHRISSQPFGNNASRSSLPAYTVAKMTCNKSICGLSPFISVLVILVLILSLPSHQTAAENIRRPAAGLTQHLTTVTGTYNAGELWKHEGLKKRDEEVCPRYLHIFPFRK